MQKNIDFGKKFVSNFVISFLMSIIVLDVVSKPARVIVATCAMKLVSVVTK